MEYPISRMPHIARLEDDNENLIDCMDACEPGEPDYAYYLDCLNENDKRLETRRLMLEADRRDVFIISSPVAKNVAGFIEFELHMIGEVDQTVGEHYLTGPKYNRHETPTPEFMRWIATQSHEERVEPHITF